MNVLFAGTPEMAVPSLVAVAQHFPIVGVLTSPDQEVGRGRNLLPSPVKQKASELNLPVLTPQTLNGEVREQVRRLSPDILVVVAYGKIFGPKFLSLFPMGGINLHPSLLPKYRGPSPIPEVILRGDTETGITIQKVALQMDAGPILHQEVIPLNGTETTATLTKLCAERGANLLVQVLKGIETGIVKEVPQDESKATYCKLLTKEDGRINWSYSAVQIERMVRAYDPWPTAWTLYRGEILKILKASVYQPFTKGERVGRVIGVDKEKGILVQTGEGILAIHRLQLQSRKALDFASFLNGERNFMGAILGE
ncbi:MAG: methionyl-tRNA formyltransferase [Spirochaetes bacterium]|nr:methionyl-tRNA formyltransferase [Spirochaetota bacterium]